MSGGGPIGNKKALKHGAYTFRDQGEKALEPSGRTRLAELREAVQDKQSLLGVMGEKAADAILTYELVLSYVSRQTQVGVPLGEIAILKALPAFHNSMQRAIAIVLANMPADDSGTDAELQRIGRVLNGTTSEEPE